MNEKVAFLEGIRAHPDEDTPRLAFADWLDENDKPKDAELIRVQCELEPIREKYGEPRTDELTAREETLLAPHQKREEKWLSPLVGRAVGTASIRLTYRRGFPDAVRLPVQWFVEHGAALRKRYPLLRKLTLHRLNGWGRELAACPHLIGIRELDLACWYSDDDGLALVHSPHLADLEVLHYWRGGRDENVRPQLAAFAGAAGWRKRRKFRVVMGYPEDVALVNNAVGHEVCEIYDPDRYELFPFEANFDPTFFVGKLPGGKQFFAFDPGACLYDPSAISTKPVKTMGQVFDADGTPKKKLKVSFPAAMVYPQLDEQNKHKLQQKREDERRAAREKLLRDTIGFEPAFIRVKQFEVEGEYGPLRDPQHQNLGAHDDPNADLATDYYGPFGYGGSVYGAVVNEEFMFNAGNIWVCDKRGHVVFT